VSVTVQPGTDARQVGRVRARQVGLLIVPLVRAVPWVPMVAAAGLALAANLPAWLGGSAPGAQVWGLRIAALSLGAAASFAMVDAMAPLTVTATPRWVRQWLRFTLVAVPAVAVWGVLCLLAVGTMPAGAPGLPVGDLVGEALACFLCGPAAAAVAARVGHTTTTALTGPAAQGLLVVGTLFLRGDRSPWPLPGQPSWPDVHIGWWAAVPAFALVLSAANREVWPLIRRLIPSS
jgi:hypothetical protein